LKKEYVVLQISMVQDATPGVSGAIVDEQILRANGDERSPTTEGTCAL
jgi:hypothetical protein